MVEEINEYPTPNTLKNIFDHAAGVAFGEFPSMKEICDWDNNHPWSNI